MAPLRAHVEVSNGTAKPNKHLSGKHLRIPGTTMRPTDEPLETLTPSAASYLDFLYSRFSAKIEEEAAIEIATAEPQPQVGNFLDQLWSSAQEGLKQADHSITHADHNILMGGMAVVLVLIIVILTYRSS